MRIVFFGTGEFALAALKKILDSRHRVSAVVTRPDQRRGRGWNIEPALIKAFMEKVAPGVDVLQPETANEDLFVSHLKKIDADVFVVVDYGMILTKEILDLAKKYCVNLHPSLLPKYRGAAPVNWAILRGEKETGNTVIKMNERMDAGDIIAAEKTKIFDKETSAQLLERLSDYGGSLLAKTLDEIEKGEETFMKQDEKSATYAPKIKKELGKIDWSLAAEEITRKVRALQPWPGAFTVLEGKTLKILEAEAVDAGVKSAKPGYVLHGGGITVMSGQGAVRVLRLQLEGKKAMTAVEFARGHALPKDTFFS